LVPPDRFTRPGGFFFGGSATLSTGIRIRPETEAVSPLAPTEKTMPATSKACRMAASRFLWGSLRRASKSRIVELLQLAFVASSSIDQPRKALAALHCSGNIATI
jgi:hypothetical protein